MFTMIILLALFLVFDLAALHWGVDSTEDIASCEWERRWHWSEDVGDRRAVWWLFL